MYFASNNLSASVVNLSCDWISCCKNSWISVYWQHNTTAELLPLWQGEWRRADSCHSNTVFSTKLNVELLHECARGPALSLLCVFIFLSLSVPFTLWWGEFPYSVHCSNSPVRPLAHGVGQNNEENDIHLSVKTKVYNTSSWSLYLYGYVLSIFKHNIKVCIISKKGIPHSHKKKQLSSKSRIHSWNQSAGYSATTGERFDTFRSGFSWWIRRRNTRQSRRALLY